MSKVPRPYSADYYAGNGQGADRPALRLFARLARRYIKAGRLLDFGCGPGYFLRHLKSHFDACGVEISPWAREQAERANGVDVYESLDEVADASLHGIVSLHVVEHISDDGLYEVLGAWRRTLVPGGRALVVTPDAGGYAASLKANRWIALTDPTHVNLKSHCQWLHLFESHGFRCIVACADGLWDFPYRFKWLGRVEALLLGWPTLLQFILAQPVIPPGRGESCIYVLEKIDTNSAG